MRDKHGNEIKVGDTLRFDSHGGTSEQGVVSAVKPDCYFVDAWADNGTDGWYSCSDYVEIVKQAEPVVQPKSLQQLKLEAQKEIQSVIQKHTALINLAGGNLDINVSFYDAKILGNGEPRQLIEVTASVTI